ncbi:MAG: hypothetical protein ABSF00_13960 [Candidatus Bathyarchaeia archaeon]|jgi:hypothetical protein
MVRAHTDVIVIVCLFRDEFVPVSFATIRALDIIPGVAWNTSDTSSRSNNPANLLE